MPETDRWDEFLPPDGAELLDEIVAMVDRYVITPSVHARDGIVLWIAATHGQTAWQNATRLVINSPEKRCGKSRLLEIIAALCHRPMMTANVSTAVLFRIIKADDPPTVLLDEADTIFGTKVKADQNEDLRGLINAGYSRHLPTWRCVGPNQVPTQFVTYAMAALAGIGQLPDTITDRALNVTMRRRAAGEIVHPYRASRDAQELHNLRDQVGEWIRTNREVLADADPVMPLEDRAADNWCSLVAVADLAGGPWPARARKAAKILTREHDKADSAESLNVQLLRDIASILQTWPDPFIPSATLATQLRSDESAPWAEFELTPRRLASRLKGFGIRPGHNAAKTERGYGRSQFDDAVTRYVPAKPDETDEIEADDPPDTVSASVRASESAPDQDRRDGRSESTDAHKRPAEISVRNVSAGHSDIRTLGRIRTETPPATYARPDDPVPGQAPWLCERCGKRSSFSLLRRGSLDVCRTCA